MERPSFWRYRERDGDVGIGVANCPDQNFKTVPKTDDTFKDQQPSVQYGKANKGQTKVGQ